MENEKQIEIKIDGNICMINYQDESQILKSKISSQNSLCGSFANIDDLTLTISKTTEDFLNNNNSNKNLNNMNNKISATNNNTNEKSKLEITYLSIFNSDKKSETSSNAKTPIYQMNNSKTKDEKNNNDISNSKYEKILKDSVIKKLNFDLCDSIKETETIKKNPELNKSTFTENITKNLNERYFIHETNLNNDHNNIITNSNDKDKNNNTITNSLETIKDNNIQKYITVNKSSKYFKNRCKSFHREKKINNKILVDSKGNLQNTKNNYENHNKNILVNINKNLFQNNSSSKINVHRANYQNNNKIYNESQKPQSDLLKEKKEKIKKYFEKLSETKSSLKASYLKLKESNYLTQMKKDQKLNTLIKIEENLETEEKINKNNNNIQPEYIMKTSKKIFPQLASANSFNTSNSKNRLNIAQLSSIKKNYFFQTPSTSNIKGGGFTTSTKNGTFSSNLNSPIISISSSKVGNYSKIDNKDIITKLYYNNSSSKINKNNENFGISKNDRKKNEFIIDREKEVVRYFLKKHNTDLKIMIKNNNKKIHTLLNGKNNHFNHFNENNNTNKINEINEFKQFIQKNQFDKELLKTIKKRGSFH